MTEPLPHQPPRSLLRAQWDINQAALMEREIGELGGGVARQLAWSLCSQSPHGEAMVARCAQWRPHQPPRWMRVVLSQFQIIGIWPH